MAVVGRKIGNGPGVNRKASRQRFQFMLYKGEVVAGILTPPSNPGYLTLSCLKLILHNVRMVIRFCLKEESLVRIQ